MKRQKSCNESICINDVTKWHKKEIIGIKFIDISMWKDNPQQTSHLLYQVVVMR